MIYKRHFYPVTIGVAGIATYRGLVHRMKKFPVNQTNAFSINFLAKILFTVYG
jgi:hypothetical protein